MRRDMEQWAAEIIAAPYPRPLPLLAAPCVQWLGVTMGQLVKSSDLQARGMIELARRFPTAAAVSVMDLSVEAEAFGAAVQYRKDSVPAVMGTLLSGAGEARRLVVPEVGVGRTGVWLAGIARAAREITSRPVLAGMIGPYSLAGLLLGVERMAQYCALEQTVVHTVVEKTTAFLIRYAQAFRSVGADGIVLAEPLAGMLPPSLARTFAHPYAAQIVAAVQRQDFAVIYHNCGSEVAAMVEDLGRIGAAGYHFGDAVDLAVLLPKLPKEALVLGNVSPGGVLRKGTPAAVRAATQMVLEQCSGYPNFVLSSGCDIPPETPAENLAAFFDTATAFYAD